MWGKPDSTCTLGVVLRTSHLAIWIAAAAVAVAGLRNRSLPPEYPQEAVLTSLLQTSKSFHLSGCSLELLHDYKQLPPPMQQFLQQQHVIFKQIRLQTLEDSTRSNSWPKPVVHNSSKGLPMWDCSTNGSRDDLFVPMVAPCLLHVVAVHRSGASRAVQLLMKRSEAMDVRRFLFWSREGTSATFLWIPGVPWMRFKTEVLIASKKAQLFTRVGWWPNHMKSLQYLGTYDIDSEDTLSPEIFTDHAGDFQGKTVQFYNLYGWRRVSGALRRIEETSYWPNFHYRYLEALSKYFNINSETYIGPMEFFNKQYPNGTCEGYVGEFLKSDAVQLIFYVPISDFLQASNLADPLNPFYSDSFTFYTRLPGTDSSWAVLIHPFGASVWIMSLVTILVTSLFLAIILTRHTSVQSETALIAGLEAGLRMCLEVGLPPLCTKTPSSALRLTMAPGLLALLVLTTFYKSELSSYLTVPEMEHLPRTFQDLAKSNWDWVMYDDFFLKTLDEVHTVPQETRAPLIARASASPLTTYGAETCLNQTLLKTSPERACIGYDYESTAWAYMNFTDIHGRLLVQRSEPILEFAVTAVVRKSSPHRAILNHALQMVQEYGLNLKWCADEHQEFLIIGMRAAREKLELGDQFWQGELVGKHSTQEAPLNIRTFSHTQKMLCLGWLIATVTLLLEMAVKRERVSILKEARFSWFFLKPAGGDHM